MRSRGAETTSRAKDMHFSYGMLFGSNSLPGIASTMRNEFLPLMQCLEQGNDVLCKTYIVELALTLSRFDALLKEEERRAFVCAFDALVRRLLKDLHHFMEVESLLNQDVVMLVELLERSRWVDHLCGCRALTCTADEAAGTLKEARSTTSNPSAVGLLAPRLKAQPGAFDSSEACGPNCLSELRQLFQSDVGRQMHPACFLPASGACSTSGNENTTNHFSSSASHLPHLLQSQALAGTTLLRNLSGKQGLWWREGFRSFLEGHISKDDITALMNLLCPGGGNTKETMQPVGDAQKDVMPHTFTKLTRMSGNSKEASSSYVTPGDTMVQKRTMQNAEDTENVSRDSDGNKGDETVMASASLKVASGGCLMNQTAVFLNMLVEGLLFGGPSSVSSLNSSFGSVEEAEQNSTVIDAANEPCCSEPMQQGDVFGRFITLPSTAALSLLSKLFPSLRNYAEDLRKLAGGLTETTDGSIASGNCALTTAFDLARRTQSGSQRPKGVQASATSPGVFGDNAVETLHAATTLSIMADATGVVRPTDVVLYLLLRSLQRVEDNSVGSFASRSLSVGETDRPTPKMSSMEPAAATSQHQSQGHVSVPAIPRRLGAELELMIKQVQEYISSAQFMQQQIREEVTLLVFRVISTTVELLIPAVQFVDPRVTIFYRKWLCDMYRLLWEEDLFERFLAILSSSLPSLSNQNVALKPPSLSPAHQATQRRGGSKRSLRKSGSVGNAATLTTGGATNKDTSNLLSEKESESVLFNDTPNEKREDVSEWIAPGNAYSRTARAFVDSSSEAPSLDSTLAAIPSKLLGPNLASIDVGLQGFGLFGDPTVFIAESLLEENVEEAPPFRGFIVTRLMAALLRDGGTDKMRHLALASERSVRGTGVAAASLNDSHSTTVRKTVPAVKNARGSTRRKNPSPYLFSTTTKLLQTTPETKTTVLQQPSSTPYPVVSSLNDVKALYDSVLEDAEMTLSPLDPIRAALVQNVVDFLVSGMRLPREAYELLDAYLDDVRIEPIQPPATRRVVLDGTPETVRGGSEYPLPVLDSPFSVTTVRRARQLPLDGPAGIGGKTHTPHSSHFAQSRRSGPVDKDANAANLRFPLIPKVIPSWNTQEETEQFLMILALLRREHIVLRAELGLAPPALCKESRDASSK
ncbi:hypothetical protein TraAM80_00771 [Trypanosoma rangeli]|uniref:Uncharacterized protein n=1 Tax=Trypanosoma rangeli TaxID=5698 RepID=A0A422P1V5_TRYRA|nr:uncharacterized protein TraAM80_00771 [Trypanosoma rangeli]RNF11687.1 hypothetical protein TraAM80_00771 [Trypanosoma rangeli]|eukprot:RNF11687.1 hypothetical protein TraAM80_00771 [Trypanosoma rangeli]